MKKIFAIARREFLATVFTKAFLISVLVPPAIMAIVLVFSPLLLNKASPKIRGHFAIIDHSGQVADRLKGVFSGEAMEGRHLQRLQQTIDNAAGGPPLKGPLQDQLHSQLPGSFTPAVSLQILPPDTNIDQAKAPIRNVTGKETSPASSNARLALIVIPATAVTLPPGSPANEPFAKFEVFTAPRLDVEWQNDIEAEVARAIVDARLEANGESVAKIRELTARPQADVKAITTTGEQSTNELAQVLVPVAFLILLWVSVLTSGQYLLTSTIEEKSSRVMEVLLSAVSPMQLMSGKILGQLCVGLTMLITQTGAGLMALVLASMMHLIDPANLLYLGIYFLIAFALIASLTAAVGSAVSDMREAQTLMGPVMLVLLLPMMFIMPILRNPNSTFATVCSFIPPISPFVMVLRVAGSEKIPTWQIPASILVGLVAIFIFMWAAAKIFRIGVLLYGKPPDFKTLLRWVRMA